MRPTSNLLEILTNIDEHIVDITQSMSKKDSALSLHRLKVEQMLKDLAASPFLNVCILFTKTQVI